MTSTGTSRERATGAHGDWVPPAHGQLLTDRYRLIVEYPDAVDRVASLIHRADHPRDPRGRRHTAREGRPMML